MGTCTINKVQVSLLKKEFENMTKKLVGVMNKEDMVTEIETLINKLDTIILGLSDMYMASNISWNDFNRFVLNTLTYKYIVREIKAKIDEQ